MRSHLVLLVALAMVTLSMAGNCSTINPITMNRDSSLYSISGGTVRVIPVKNGEALVNSAIRWDLSYFIERAKVTRDIDGNAIDPTAVLPLRPDSSIWSPADPLESHDPSKACTGKTLPCGPVLNYLDPADYDCWMEHVTAPFHGFTRESVFVHFSHPSYPDLSIVVGNHLLDGDLEVRPPMQGLQDVNVYSPGALKVTYEVKNWPWTETAPIVSGPTSHNGSTVEIWWDMHRTYCRKHPVQVRTVDMDREHVIVNVNSPERRSVSIASTDGQIRMAVNFSNTIVADGFGLGFYFVSYYERNFTFPSLSMDVNAPVLIDHPNVTRWTIVDYDPTLAALFVPSPTPDNPSASPASKGLSKGAKAAIIAVVVIVVVLTVVIALLAAFVPAVRAFFRPFAKRELLAREANRQRQTTWTRSSMPVNDAELSSN